MFTKCLTVVSSTGNMHTVTCNNMTSTTIACGSYLLGKNTGLIPLIKHKHQLCSEKSYLSIQMDMEWSCKDQSVPVPATSYCPGDVTTVTTVTVTVTVTVFLRDFQKTSQEVPQLSSE